MNKREDKAGFEAGGSLLLFRRPIANCIHSDGKQSENRIAELRLAVERVSRDGKLFFSHRTLCVSFQGRVDVWVRWRLLQIAQLETKEAAHRRDFLFHPHTGGFERENFLDGKNSFLSLVVTPPPHFAPFHDVTSTHKLRKTLGSWMKISSVESKCLR